MSMEIPGSKNRCLPVLSKKQNVSEDESTCMTFPTSAMSLMGSNGEGEDTYDSVTFGDSSHNVVV